VMWSSTYNNGGVVGGLGNIWGFFPRLNLSVQLKIHRQHSSLFYHYAGALGKIRGHGGTMGQQSQRSAQKSPVRGGRVD